MRQAEITRHKGRSQSAVTRRVEAGVGTIVAYLNSEVYTGDADRESD